MFEKLIGVGYVREMILAGASEAEIRSPLGGRRAALPEAARALPAFTNNLTTAPESSGAVVR